MAAQITLFLAVGPFGPTAWKPVASHSATFGPVDKDYEMRVGASGADVSLQWGGMTAPITVFSGTSESFGLSAGDTVTVS